MLWQRFWLDLCTKAVVSARACANQFLPCSSSGIALFGMRTVQTDSCLHSEQTETLFISVGRKGVGGGGHFRLEAQQMHVGVRNFVFAGGFNPLSWSFYGIYVLGLSVCT